MVTVINSKTNSGKLKPYLIQKVNENHINGVISKFVIENENEKEV